MKTYTKFLIAAFSNMKCNWKQSIARFSFCFIFLLLSLHSFPQYRQWEFNVGQGDAYSMIQAKDGSYAMAGQGGPSNVNFYMVKLDTMGNLKWGKAITGSTFSIAYSITQTKDGGFAATGYCNGGIGAGGEDVYVVKVDASGNLLWTKTIGGPDDDWGNAIVATKDGGLAITGGTKSFGGGAPGSADIYVIKLDASGNKIWTKTIEGPWGSDDEGKSIVQASDGGYAVTGSTLNTMGDAAFFVFKLDSVGNLKWANVIGGSTSGGIGYSIIETTDKGYALTGYTASYGVGIHNVYVIKLDSAGNLKWTKTIGGSGIDEGESIIQAKDKGYAIAGGTNSFGLSSSDIYLIRLDSAGSLIWGNTFGGPGGDIGYSIIQTKDYGYAVGGYDSSFIFLKIDSSGNSCTKSGSGGLVGSGGIITSGGTVTSSNGGIMGSGGVASSWGSETIVCQSTGIDELTQQAEHITVSPNPSNGVFTIESSVVSRKSLVEIYNVLGERVYSAALTQPLPSGRGVSKQIDLSGCSTGIYLYRITTEQGDFVGSGKLLLKK